MPKMGKDRKHMKKVRKKRIESVDGQIAEHEEKIEGGEVRKDTTREYWKKEIDEKFLKQKKEDEEYLDEH
jgi:hypothetical protein